MTQTLKINGRVKQFPEGQIPQTLSELLQQLNIDQATVVAEIDGRVIERASFTETKLAPGASIELVRFVGGG
ncbi:MAG: sulfur carrier protein ThiS [Planctomycetota bacterium]|jgi:thiamine biosynthesis protein ThiS